MWGNPTLIADLAQNLKVPVGHLIKTSRGDGDRSGLGLRQFSGQKPHLEVKTWQALRRNVGALVSHQRGCRPSSASSTPSLIASSSSGMTAPSRPTIALTRSSCVQPDRAASLPNAYPRPAVYGRSSRGTIIVSAIIGGGRSPSILAGTAATPMPESHSPVQVFRKYSEIL
jgi:hypothetical protein